MRATVTFAIALAASALATAVRADEPAPPFADMTALSAEELDGRRGGTQVAGVSQNVDTSQDASNDGNLISIGSGGTMSTGSVHTANITGNNGIITVMQNTGNLVNMTYASSINVNIH